MAGRTRGHMTAGRFDKIEVGRKNGLSGTVFRTSGSGFLPELVIVIYFFDRKNSHYKQLTLEVEVAG